MNKKIIGILSAGAVLLSGCATEITQSPTDVPPAIATSTTALVDDETPAVTTEAQPQALDLPKTPLDVAEISRQDVNVTLEAEDAAIPSGCSIAVMPRLGYSGSGYMGGLDAVNQAEISFPTEIPTPQHYDITLTMGTDSPATCKLLVNKELAYVFTASPTQNFVRITIPGLYLKGGNCTLTVAPQNGIVDIDCLTLTNNTTVGTEEDEVSVEDLVRTPVNENATESAKKLYTFLRTNYGKKVITGQEASSPENAEIERIYAATGEYPLIRFAEIGAYTEKGMDPSADTAVNDSIAWAKEGGIVGLSWLWDAPTGLSSIYSEKTEYDLSVTVPDESLATQSLSALGELRTNGSISEETYQLIANIDDVADKLQLLASMDIPVLWRPLPEASGGWYWWGSAGPAAYKQLWSFLYTRMTAYHKLNNLLWVWNGQSDQYLVDEATFDIAAVDLYLAPEQPFGSRYEQFTALKAICPDKLFAISECSTVPDLYQIFRDKATWSYFNLWTMPYITNVTDDMLKAMYNSEAAITRNDYLKAMSGQLKIG